MKYVILGGTGTLGTSLIDRLHEKHEVVCFSRDELKQQELKRLYPNVQYVLGDIRDRRSLNGFLKNAEAVFHVAALKHVDSGEANPVEFIKTNVLGTINVAEACQDAGVKHVIFSSTDKAVLPINTYGMTKGISERYLLSLNARSSKTKFAVYRWGNVAGSRGSVIHTFVESLRTQKGVRVTDPRMTRFWIHIEDAVDFMLNTYKDASPSKAMIPPMKASKVTALAAALAGKLNIKDFSVAFVGIRPGEKIHECLESSHDACIRSDTCEEYTQAELQALIERVIAC